MVKQGLRSTTPDSTHDFLKYMTREAVDSYVATSKIWHVTVGPGDALFLPFDAVFLERVHASEDCLGFRASTWLHTDAANMVSVNRWLLSCKKPNTYLQEGCDVEAATAD